MSDERRSEKRIPVEMWVEEHHGKDTYFQRSGNLSVSGIYLDGTLPHPRGTQVDLRFTLPGDTDPIELRGEIVGDDTPAVGEGGAKLGMHVRFVNLDSVPGVAERLRRFVERVTNAKD